MRLIVFSISVLLTILSLVSCTSDKSENPYAQFFFPYNKEAKIYVYRDVVQGLNEKFFRVYGVDDSYGKHIIVESYTMDGRITEALNYKYADLTVIDHMIVNRDKVKTKTQLIKNTIFPKNENDKTWFASKFPGFLDSTYILSETKRSFVQSTPIKSTVLGEAKNTIVTLDTMRFTMINPFTKNENEQKAVFKSYYAEGIGLVRIHDINMKTDYKLEKILNQQEWIRLMQR